jgi:EAL and modified HD-GYP domain-containing signal transduction protein
MNNSFTFVLPLLNPHQAWGAAEVCASEASTEAIQEACALLPEQIKLLHVEASWLADDAFVANLAPGRVIFALPHGAFNDPLVQPRIAALHAHGHIFAINDLASLTEHGPLANEIDYAILPAMTARDRLPPEVLARVHGAGIKLIASAVLNDELFAWAVSKGFALFSGEFVVQQDDLPTTGTDPTKLKLLKLLSLVVQDADTRELEEVFKQEPKLSYNLMRLVNSVSMGGGQTHVSNFGQAITLLGRRQLQRWLQLLIYANQFGTSEPNPLMLEAALRGRLLEELTASLPAIAEQSDYGFMSGIFSLLDIQLGIRMADIVAALPLTDEVSQALAERQGVFGQLLTAVERIEQRDFPTAIDILSKHGITPALFAAAQKTAFTWVSHLNME